jgi:hypothetical protein
MIRLKLGKVGSEFLDLVLNLLALGEGIVHALLDVLGQGLVVHVAEAELAVDTSLLGSADDAAGDNDADLADAADVGVHPVHLDLLGEERLREGLARGVDHGLSDVDGLGQDGTESNTGEDVHVVSLARLKSLAVVLESGERRARSEEDAALGVLDGVLEGALGLAAGVGQGEDDGHLVQLGHTLDDVGSEGTADGAETHEDGGLDVLDDVLESLVLLALVVVTREVELVLGELVATVVGDETLGVDEPEALSGLVLGEALVHEELDELLGDTDTGRASTEEDGTLVSGGNLGLLDTVDETTEDDSTGTLDVVVEHGVGVLVTLERREGVLEVLVLDDDTGPALGKGGHELVKELTLLIGRDLVASAAHVQRVVAELLVAGSQVESEGESGIGSDTSAGSVESELADRDTHAVDTKVTETEDTGTVSDDGDLDVVGPVLDDGVEVALVREGEVHAWKESEKSNCMRQAERAYLRAGCRVLTIAGRPRRRWECR